MSRVKLRILATSDLHAQLLSFDYKRDIPKHSLGLQALVPLITQLRQGTDISLLLDNGDLLSGSVLADLFSDDPIDCAKPHPVIEMLNLLEFDAVGLGNHDFNFGLDHLKWAAHSAKFPVIASNVKTKATQKPPTGIWEECILDKAAQDKKIRIGILSGAPPEILDWDKDLYHDILEVEPIVSCLQAKARSMRAQGVDVIIALCHSGIDLSDTPTTENVGHILAQNADIDALVLGHQHMLFPPSETPYLDLLHGVPAVMPGSFGSHLGVIDLDLEFSDGHWSVKKSTAVLHEADPTETELPLQAAQLMRNHDRARKILSEQVFENWPACHGHFIELGHDQISAVFAQAQGWWVQNFADSFIEAPLLSAYAPLHAQRHQLRYKSPVCENGPLLRRDVYALAPLFNRLALVTMTGAQIIDFLERSASYFAPIESGALFEDIPLYSLENLFGMEYTIDLSQGPRHDPKGNIIDPRRRRIQNIRYQGKALDKNATFQVVMSHYRAGGGGNFPHLSSATTQVFDISTRDAFIKYLAHVPQIAVTNPKIKITAPKGTSLLYSTDRRAESHLEEVAKLNPKIIERADDYLKLLLRF